MGDDNGPLLASWALMVSWVASAIYAFTALSPAGTSLPPWDFTRDGVVTITDLGWFLRFFTLAPLHLLLHYLPPGVGVFFEAPGWQPIGTTALFLSIVVWTVWAVVAFIVAPAVAAIFDGAEKEREAKRAAKRAAAPGKPHVGLDGQTYGRHDVPPRHS